MPLPANLQEAILAAVPDGILVVGPDGVISYANRQAVTLSGYEADELVGMPVEHLVPPPLRERHQRNRETYRLAPSIRTMGSQLDIHILCSDGRQLPVDISLSPLDEEGPPSVVVAIRDITAHREVERKHAQLRQRLALVDDRERIARDIHDTVIQTLFGVGMNLQASLGRVDDPDLLTRLEDAVARIDGSIKNLRDYIFELRPAGALEAGLEDLVVQLGADLESQAGLAFDLAVEPDAAALLSAHVHELGRAVQEAFSNIARHASATTVTVAIRRANGQGVIEIRDNGRGFDELRTGQRGHGLRNIRERARRMGGDAIFSTGRDGTTVRISVPL
ncbi:MAG: PAS domain-containing sensor histidine kinase [Candidatus Dormibacteria bacterium]